MKQSLIRPSMVSLQKMLPVLIREMISGIVFTPLLATGIKRAWRFPRSLGTAISFDLSHDEIDVVGAFTGQRRLDAREVAGRAHAGIKIERLADRHIQAANPLAHRCRHGAVRLSQPVRRFCRADPAGLAVGGNHGNDGDLVVKVVGERVETVELVGGPDGGGLDAEGSLVGWGFTTLNAGGAYLVNDLYKRYIKKEASPRHYVAASWIAQIVILAVGIWGMDGLGVLSGGGFAQLGIQVIGIVAAIVFVFPVSYLMFQAIDKTIGLRVKPEVESAGIPVWLLVCDAEGMSVLTAWAAGKFDSERIAKDVKLFDVANKVNEKKLILPGHVAVLSGETEEELPGWDIKVGPREAVDLPSFMKQVL